MLVEIRKLVAVNSKGSFMTLDSRSGGYPCVSNNISEALMFDETDEDGKQKLQDFIFNFSDKDHGGKNNLHSNFNGFKVVTMKISYEI